MTQCSTSRVSNNGNSNRISELHRTTIAWAWRLIAAAALILVFLVDSVPGWDLRSQPTPTLSSNGFQEPVVSVMTAPPELRRRQQQVLSTCGFIDGDASRPVSCQPGLYCAVYSTFVGCCSSTNCRYIKTACYDHLGAVCDQACQNNPRNQVCPSDFPYCAQFNYEGGSIGIGCEAYPGLTSTVLLTPATGLATLTTPTAGVISTVTDSSSGATTTTDSPTASSSPSSGLSGGAIAGIVIGVLIGVAFSIFGVWFVMRRSRKPKEPETEIADVPHKPVRDSALTELSSEAPSQPRIPETSSNPNSSNNWTTTNYPAQSAYIPEHHGREFTNVPEEMPDTSRPVEVPSTAATGSNSRS